MVRRLMVSLLGLLLLAACASTQPDMQALRPTESAETGVIRITYPQGMTEYVGRAEFEQVRDKLMQPGTPEQDILDFLASRHLLLQEARVKDVTADPNEVEQAVSSIREQTCPTVPEVQGETDAAKALDVCARAFGFDGASAMRRFLQEEITINNLLRQEAEPGEEVRAAHILVETEEEARQVRERVTTGGEDFAEVARQVSTDPSAQENGGDLDFFGRGAMTPPFEEAAFGMQPGDISQPVQTDFGWHIIKLIDRRPAEGLNEQAAAAYRQEILQRARAEGRVEYLITPAPPAAPPMELPTADATEEQTPGADATTEVAPPASATQVETTTAGVAEDATATVGAEDE